MSPARLATVVAAALLFVAAACSQPNDQPVGTPVIVPNPRATPRPAATSAGPVQIAQVVIQPQDAIIVLNNTGGPNQAATIDLQDWKLQVQTVSVILPAGVRIAPRQNLLIHTGPEPGLTPTPGTAVSPVPAGAPNADLYLGPSGAALREALQPGVELELLDPKEVIVSLYVLPQLPQR
jgi:hypothetical protein